MGGEDADDETSISEDSQEHLCPENSMIFSRVLEENQLLGNIGLENTFSSAAQESESDELSSVMSSAASVDDWSSASGSHQHQDTGNTCKRDLEVDDSTIDVQHKAKKCRLDDSNGVCVAQSVVAMGALEPCGPTTLDELDARTPITACVSEFGDDPDDSNAEQSSLCEQSLEAVLLASGDPKVDVVLRRRVSDEGSRECSPVPLLTPPRSPICINKDQEVAVIQSAEQTDVLVDPITFSSAYWLRPPSPVFQDRLTYEYEDRLLACLEHRYSPPTILAPLMKGV